MHVHVHVCAAKLKPGQGPVGCTSSTGCPKHGNLHGPDKPTIGTNCNSTLCTDLLPTPLTLLMRKEKHTMSGSRRCWANVLSWHRMALVASLFAAQVAIAVDVGALNQAKAQQLNRDVPTQRDVLMFAVGKDHWCAHAFTLSGTVSVWLCVR